MSFDFALTPRQNCWGDAPVREQAEHIYYPLVSLFTGAVRISWLIAWINVLAFLPFG